MHPTLLIPALLAASTLASPVAFRKRQDDSATDVVVDIEVVTDIVYVSDNTPVSTSICPEDSTPTPISTSAAQATPDSSAPISNAAGQAATAPAPTSTSTISPSSSTASTPSTSLHIFATPAPGMPACSQPLIVDPSGNPILIGLTGGLTLSACTFTSTSTRNPLTLISDTALLPTIASTTAPSGAGQGSTAVLPVFSVTSEAAAASAKMGQDGSGSASVHALFTTPSAFASAASSLTKVTAAPTFGAELTALSVLATASGSVSAGQGQVQGAPAAQETGGSGVVVASVVDRETTAKAFAGAAYTGAV